MISHHQILSEYILIFTKLLSFTDAIGFMNSEYLYIFILSYIFNHIRFICGFPGLVMTLYCLDV